MRGIISAGGYVPRHRLDRAEIAALFGKGGGRGTRAVACFDEDTTTVGYAAARNALRSAGRPPRTAANQPGPEVWFATSTPAYLDKTNACAIHAALGLDHRVGALDFGGALRSGIGALRTALAGRGSTLVVAADMRDGMPTSTEESMAGDGAAAILVEGDGSKDKSDAVDGRGNSTRAGRGADGHGNHCEHESPRDEDASGCEPAGDLIARLLGSGTASDEFLDRWRLPGSRSPSSSPERFGEVAFAPLLTAAWTAALQGAGIDAADVDRLLVTGMNARAVQRNARVFAGAPDPAQGIAGRIASSVGNTGTAHPLLLLTAALEQAGPGEVIAVVLAADGAEVLIFRTTDAIAGYQPSSPLRSQIDSGTALSYGTFLSWRGMATVEPPNRPPPSGPSAAASYRRRSWKFGFTGSRDRSSGMVHLPPARVSERGGAVDDMEQAPMAHTGGTIAAVTVDRLAYSPSPPVVFAVVDFDGGGRVPLELTDASADEVAVGDRVEPTFRRLFTADGIHNYFWKARPVRDPGPGEPAGSTAEAATGGPAPDPAVSDTSDTSEQRAVSGNSASSQGAEPGEHGAVPGPSEPREGDA